MSVQLHILPCSYQLIFTQSSSYSIVIIALINPLLLLCILQRPFNQSTTTKPQSAIIIENETAAFGIQNLYIHYFTKYIYKYIDLYFILFSLFGIFFSSRYFIFELVSLKQNIIFYHNYIPIYIR